MTLPRFFSPTVTVRLFDPMPLPRQSAARRRARITVRNAPDTKKETLAAVVAKKRAVKPSRVKKFTFKVRNIPLNA